MGRRNVRLRDQSGKSSEAASQPARKDILAAEGPEESDEESNTDGQPTVVAEMTTEIPTLTVSEAVMRMDLASQPAMMFRNSAHGGLNMIYQRSDGNIGWIDPRGNRAIGRAHV